MLRGFPDDDARQTDVTGRTVFNHPLTGTTEIVAGWYMVAAAYLPLGLYLAHRQPHLGRYVQRIASPRFVAWLEI